MEEIGRVRVHFKAFRSFGEIWSVLESLVAFGFVWERLDDFRRVFERLGDFGCVW